ncbi:histidine kinase [Gardnerella vaginalis]|uniref:histidine kinase n=1 Tax=Gardnerella vaginalis TaxID=2702 RepID=UPI0039EF6CF7
MIIFLMRRLREKLIDNKTFLLLGCLSSAMDAYIYSNSDNSTIQLVIVYMILAAMNLFLCLLPHFMSMCYIFVHLSILVIPSLNLPPVTFGLIISFVFISYLYPIQFTLPLFLVIDALHYVAYRYLSTLSFKYLIAYLLINIFCVCTGIILRIYHQKMVLYEKDRQTINNLNLAVRMHDKLTNKIADIALQSKIALLDKSISKKQREAIEEINDLADQAFEEGHNIIDILRGNTAKHDARSEFIQRIENTLQMNDSINESCGLKGRSICNISSNDIPEDISDEIICEVIELIEELYLNMRKYASLVYYIRISIREKQIVIKQFNVRFLGKKSKDAIRAVSQKGLPIHRDILKHLGGSLYFRAFGKYWECNAVIPLKNEHNRINSILY